MEPVMPSKNHHGHPDNPLFQPPAPVSPQNDREDKELAHVRVLLYGQTITALRGRITTRTDGPTWLDVDLGQLAKKLQHFPDPELDHFITVNLPTLLSGVNIAKIITANHAEES